MVYILGIDWEIEQMTEKICANCIHYGMWSICELDGSYTGSEWYCELFDGDGDD